MQTRKPKAATGARKAAAAAKFDETANGMTPQMWARLRAMTPQEALANARRDPDNVPLEDRRPGSLSPPRHVARAKRIRWQLRMSQTDFAATFRIPVGTLRDWEQHRREPDQAARAYLEVIAAEPDAVRRALAGKQPEAA